MRVVSLAPGKLLEQKSLAALLARPHLKALQYVPESNGGVDEVILSRCRSGDCEMSKNWPTLASLPVENRPSCWWQADTGRMKDC
eukprot:3945973-Ditylum_brightwellii.AAC.1